MKEDNKKYTRIRMAFTALPLAHHLIARAALRFHQLKHSPLDGLEGMTVRREKCKEQESRERRGREKKRDRKREEGVREGSQPSLL